MKKIIILLGIALLLGSCIMPLGTPSSPSSSLEANSGTVTITLPDSSRTIMPDTTGVIQSYRLSLTEVGGASLVEVQNVPYPWPGVSFTNLSYGEYTLSVEAFTGADAAGTKVAGNGLGQAVVVDSESVSVVAEIGYLLEGTGDVDISFTWPDSLGVDTVSASWNGGTPTNLSLVPGSGTASANFTLSDVDAGDGHGIFVRFMKDGQDIGAPADQRVWVFHGITTSYDYILDINDFVAEPDAPSGISATASTGGVIVSWSDNSLFENGYVLERKLSGESTWSEVALDIPSNTTQVLDDTIPAALTDKVEYRVAAYNARGNSSFDTYGSAINTTGYIHPTSGDWSPLDENGAAEGFGWSSASWPRGAHFSGGDLEIGVYSTRAQRILLEIYSQEHFWATAKSGLPENGGHAVYEYWMEKGSDDVWRAKIDNLQAYESTGILYAFRVWGPNWEWSEDWLRGNSAVGFEDDYQSTGAYPPVVDRFNPNKVLTDPYAYELSHDTEYPALDAGGENGGMYGTGGAEALDYDGLPAPSTYTGTISTGGAIIDRREVDTGRFVSKSYAIDISLYTGGEPDIPEKDMIVYEAHVRGLTKHVSSSDLANIVGGIAGFEQVGSVTPSYRGTYLGAAEMAPYIAALGINAIEFVPIHETRNDMNDSFTGVGKNPGNYWGYMTYSFFAPDRNYAFDKSPGGPTREFKQMVDAFADHGVEVWLDVVYNHTGEGGNWGAPDIVGWTSYGGFGATDYYHINPFDHSSVETGATGTGNQINFSEGRANNHLLVMDSLEYWIHYMGVAGFRFDLAAVLARDPDSISANPGNPMSYWNSVKGVKAVDPDGAGPLKPYITHSLPIAIASLGANTNTKMVAETWDNWTYPVGMYPDGWMEWNGRYRDATRRYMNRGNTAGHEDVSYTDAFNGDYNWYNDQGGSEKTVNFLVAHDGFTLADLVSYNTKTNTTRLWPFGPSDGGADGNESWDSDGDQSLRRQRIRGFWVWQMFSRGVPMIVWGDEFARTQNGNNNPYNIDSIATWNNYYFINSDAPQTASTGTTGEIYHNNLGTDINSDNTNTLFKFASYVMNLRQGEPGLRGGDYNVPIDYSRETTALQNTPGEQFNGWNHGAVRVHIKGSTVSGGSDYLILSNMASNEIAFDYPSPPSGTTWTRIIDTSSWAESNDNYWEDEAAWSWTSGTYGVNPYALVVFKAQ